MKKDKLDEILSGIDTVLAEMPPVQCWRCERRMGEPSTCVECKRELGHYQSPPKGTKRKLWPPPDPPLKPAG